MLFTDSTRESCVSRMKMNMTKKENDMDNNKIPLLTPMYGRKIDESYEFAEVLPPNTIGVVFNPEAEIAHLHVLRKLRKRMNNEV